MRLENAFLQSGYVMVPKTAKVVLTRKTVVSHGTNLNWRYQYINFDLSCNLTEGPTRCSKEEFRCVESGVCISQRNVCDGEKNCKDGSDESVSYCGTYTA